MSLTAIAERPVVVRVTGFCGLSLRSLSDTTGVREALAAAIDEGRTVEAKRLLPRYQAMVRERQSKRQPAFNTQEANEHGN